MVMDKNDLEPAFILELSASINWCSKYIINFTVELTCSILVFFFCLNHHKLILFPCRTPWDTTYPCTSASWGWRTWKVRCGLWMRLSSIDDDLKDPQPGMFNQSISARNSSKPNNVRKTSIIVSFGTNPLN